MDVAVIGMRLIFVMRRSFDNGKTWDEPRIVVNHKDYGDGPLHNCNTIVDHVNQTVHVSVLLELWGEHST